MVKETQTRADLDSSSAGGNAQKEDPLQIKTLSRINKLSVPKKQSTQSSDKSPQREHRIENNTDHHLGGDKKAKLEVDVINDERGSGQDTRENKSKLVDPVHILQEQNLRIEQAVRFLRHPSILALSLLEKESYLRSKGLSNDEIEISKTALGKGTLNNSSDMEGAWKNGLDHSSSKNVHNGALAPMRRDTYHLTDQLQNHASPQQEIHGSYNHPKLDNPELPNPLVPVTLGGIIALFGLATLRWLNGGDFILFPPSSTSVENHILQARDESLQSGLVEDENTIVGKMQITSNAPYLGEEEQTEENSGSSSAEDDKLINQSEERWDKVDPDITSGTRNTQQTNISTTFQENSFHSALPLELRNLTKAIETHSSLQERILQLSSNEKAKNGVDSAMNLLRHHSTSSPNLQEEIAEIKAVQPTEEMIDDNKEMKPSFDLTILVQITEIKCALNSVKDEIKNFGSTRTLPHTQSVNNELEGDKGDMDTFEPYAGMCTVLNKLDEMSTTLSHIESKLSCNGNPAQDEQLAKSKNQTAEKKRLTTSAIDVCKATSDEQQTDLIDNQSATIAPCLPSNCNSQNQVLSSALQHLVKENTMKQVQSCAQMLFMYTTNLSSNPNVPRYRKVYTRNSTFKNKVDNVEGARNVLISVGFVDQGSYLEWKGDEANAETMGDSSVNLLKEAAEALSLLKNGKQLNDNNVDMETKQSKLSVDMENSDTPLIEPSCPLTSSSIKP